MQSKVCECCVEDKILKDFPIYGGNGGKVNIETDGDNAEVAKSVNGYKLPMVVSVNMSLKFMESRNNNTQIKKTFDGKIVYRPKI